MKCLTQADARVRHTHSRIENTEGQEGDLSLKTGSFRMRGLACGFVLLAASSLGWASEVHTNPLNRDPLVREAYEHFYNLDYPGAVERFERFHAGASRRSAGHRAAAQRRALPGALPARPAGHHLLRQRRLSHRPPRHRGGSQDPRPHPGAGRRGHPRGRLRAQPQPQRHRRPLCPRLGAQPQVHLYRHGGAGVWRRLPAGHQGQGRRRARAATRPGLCGRQAGGGGLRVRGGRAALALQAADRLCRHHRLEDARAWRCSTTTAIAA